MKIETNKEKAAYHLAMAYMYENDISLINAYDHKSGMGGVTIAFGNVFPNSKMVEVAVSYCDIKDKYVEEVGNLLALNKFQDGEIVQLPIGRADTQKQADIIFAMFVKEIYGK